MSAITTENYIRPAISSFDGVSMASVPDKAGFAREVRKVLAPGGKFAVVNWYPAPREQTLVLGVPRGPSTEMRISPRQTGESIEPAGFALERVVDLPPYHYGVIFARGR